MIAVMLNEAKFPKSRTRLKPEPRGRGQLFKAEDGFTMNGQMTLSSGVGQPCRS